MVVVRPSPLVLRASLVVVLLLVGFAPAPAVAEDPASCTAHPNIVIQGDVGPLGLILGHDPLTGEPIPRPGSGVVGGSGTESDPYRISGWCIQGPAGPAIVRNAPGMLIRDTTAHLLITGNTLTGHGDALRLENVRNVRITDNLIVDNRDAGVRIDASGAVRIDHNLFESNNRGIRVGAADHLAVHDNRIAWNVVGIFARGIRDTHIAENAFANNSYHLDLGDVQDVEFSHNTLHGSLSEVYEYGLLVRDAHAVTLHANRFYGISMSAILQHARNGSITENVFHGNENDLLIGESVELVIARNELELGLGLFGTGPQHYAHTVTANHVQGRPLVYLYNVTDQIVPALAGQVIVAHSSNVTVSGQQLDGVRRGIDAAFSDQVIIRENELTGRAGIHLYQVSGADVSNNTLAGVMLILTSNSRLHHNDVGGQGFGVDILASRDLRIDHNQISGASYAGILLLDAPGTTIHHNDIHGNSASGSNGTGLNAFSLGEDIDARHNWWGCPEGPGHPACDRVQGDAVATPWLTAPAPNAGRLV